MKVPAGTQVYDEDNETLICDLTVVGQRFLLAKGGNGGFGNQHFKTSTNQAPRRANPGLPGEEHMDLAPAEADRRCRPGRPAQRRQIDLPRGRHVRPSRRSPTIPSRRCIPNLGVARIDAREFVIADIPGLIEGAHEGVGIGDRFLGHVERTRVLLHLVSAQEESPGKAYKTVRAELAAYGGGLAEKPEIVALSQADTSMRLCARRRSLVEAGRRTRAAGAFRRHRRRRRAGAARPDRRG